MGGRLWAANCCGCFGLVVLCGLLGQVLGELGIIGVKDFADGHVADTQVEGFVALESFPQGPDYFDLAGATVFFPFGAFGAEHAEVFKIVTHVPVAAAGTVK